ncbi:hypothetical protein ACFS2C_19430 [Prauserella oleivorans]|uniref:DUF4259 domain-containing protein n=1 Tax=Prauserella oleivorans TaxID=1478153 RepID=A0ABW5WGT8_9PSEU
MYTVDTWTLANGMTARIVLDEHVESPREWHTVATLVQLSDDYLQPDEPNPLAEALPRAWRRCGDLALVERCARAYLDAVAIDCWDDATSSGRVLGVITAPDATREQLPDPAATLRAELDTYRQWAEGCVYGVIGSAPDGHDASMWDCYDNDPPDFPYLHHLADDLADDVAARPLCDTTCTGEVTAP